MIGNTERFQKLFRKYRLRAEFSTLSELGNALAEKGLIYEDSIFSHWQKGTRIPQSRNILLKLIEIFAERGAMTTLVQANDFMSSANQGYLTEEEAEKIKFTAMPHVPFQIPNQIAYFTGREKIIEKVKKLLTHGNIVHIYGSPGVGKSALAIQLGHLMKDVYSDGILWYRLDTSDVMDILLSIAFSFGEDVGNIQDKEIRASCVRSLLSEKKVLLLLDNAEINTEIGLILPNSECCSVIITSRLAELPIPAAHESILVETFTQNETLELFTTILGKDYVNQHASKIVLLGSSIGNFPLALQILAKELKRNSISITDLTKKMEEDLFFEKLSYESRNLFSAIDVSYNLLDKTEKAVFISLAVFNGKDFSVDCAAYINDLSFPKIKSILQNLKSISLIEESTENRYRIHTIIKRFARKKLDNPAIFSTAARYYIRFLGTYDKIYLKSYPNIKQESENVLYIFRKCHELNYWNEVIALWNPLETMLHATNQLSKMRYIYQIAHVQKTGINKFQKISIALFLLIIIYWIWLNLSGLQTTFWNYFYGDLFGIFPVFGSIAGFFISKQWGVFKSSIGKSVLFLSGGLLSWGIGNVIWNYYNLFLDIPIPYPSLADLGYIISYPLWTIGILNLPRAIGEEINISKKYGKLLFIIPLCITALSFYLMVILTNSSFIFSPVTSYIKLFFDIAYPVGGIIILTTALLVGISFKFFGGRYQTSIYTILLGFCMQYIADFLFTYTTTNGSFYNGNIADLMFTIALFTITFGVLGFYPSTSPDVTSGRYGVSHS